jgi:signal transduction histidine kinase
MIPTDGTLPRSNAAHESAHSGSTSTVTQKRLSLLAVDDSNSDLNLLARAVSSIGEWDADLVACKDPAEFLAAIENRAFDAFLVDYTLGSVNGVELMKEARQLGALCPTIFLTVREDAKSAVHALQSGAADFLSKDDLTAENLRRAVEGALERRNLQLAITEYRKRLERAKENLERKNEEIRSFYKTITQELTSPLSAALEVLTGLVEGDEKVLDPEHKEAIQAVRESCNQIAICLNDVLDAGRLEAGRLALWLRPDDLGEAVERAVSTYATRAKKHGVALEMMVAPGMDPALIDRQRTHQLLSNLLERAIQSTPAGGRIQIEVHEDPFDPAFLDVSVTDSGADLPKAEVDRILTLFCRTDVVGFGKGRDAASEHAAIGPGLVLCHEIVRLHGGEIAVESEIGRGTTFSFTLPKAP